MFYDLSEEGHKRNTFFKLVCHIEKDGIGPSGERVVGAFLLGKNIDEML